MCSCANIVFQIAFCPLQCKQFNIFIQGNYVSLCSFAKLNEASSLVFWFSILILESFSQLTLLFELIFRVCGDQNRARLRCHHSLISRYLFSHLQELSPWYILGCYFLLCQCIRQVPLQYIQTDSLYVLATSCLCYMCTCMLDGGHESSEGLGWKGSTCHTEGTERHMVLLAEHTTGGC